MQSVKVSQSCPTLCDPMDYSVHGILQARILACSLLQGIFPTEGSNLSPHCKRILYQLSHIYSVKYICLKTSLVRSVLGPIFVNLATYSLEAFHPEPFSYIVKTGVISREVGCSADLSRPRGGSAVSAARPKV